MKKFICYNIHSVTGSLIGDLWLIYFFFSHFGRPQRPVHLPNQSGSQRRAIQTAGPPVGADTASGVNCRFKMTANALAFARCRYRVLQGLDCFKFFAWRNAFPVPPPRTCATWKKACRKKRNKPTAQTGALPGATWSRFGACVLQTLLFGIVCFAT